MWHAAGLVPGIVALALMAVTSSSLGQQVWGQRIWDHKTDEQHRIVVDERGTPVNERRRGKVLAGLTYNWRLLKQGEDDGPILFTCLGINPASGSGLMFEPIEVLYTNLLDGDLLSVFNQRGRCWACRVQRQPDGSFRAVPGLYSSSVGPAMQSAELARGDGGALLLSVTDTRKETLRFRMRSRQDRPSGQLVYYWDPVLPAGKAK